jgi:hypothetical protein
LNDEQAALLRQKRYLGSEKTYGVIPDQGLIFFYESAQKGAGRSAAIAMARVLRRYLATEDAAQGLAKDRGVLSDRDVRTMAKGQDLCVTEFDNLMLFTNPVPLKHLKKIGCADEANMVTARAVGGDAALSLIQAGQPKCVR